MAKAKLLVVGFFAIVFAVFVLHGIEAATEYNDNIGDDIQELAQASSEEIEVLGDDVTSSEDGEIENHDPDAHLIPSTNRRLAQKPKLTCNKYPQICHNKGSPGPHCCKKQCVNVMTDRLNCGMCGYKCRKNEGCCGGRCVNLLNDERNCGSCKKRCKRGDICFHGLCNYA